MNEWTSELMNIQSWLKGKLGRNKDNQSLGDWGAGVEV